MWIEHNFGLHFDHRFYFHCSRESSVFQPSERYVWLTKSIIDSFRVKHFLHSAQQNVNVFCCCFCYYCWICVSISSLDNHSTHIRISLRYIFFDQQSKVNCSDQISISVHRYTVSQPIQYTRPIPLYVTVQFLMLHTNVL